MKRLRHYHSNPGDREIDPLGSFDTARREPLAEPWSPVSLSSGTSAEAAVARAEACGVLNCNLASDSLSPTSPVAVPLLSLAVQIA